MNDFESNLFNSFSAELETESRAFLGTLRARCARSAPMKAVDQDHIFLWEHRPRHAGT